MGVCFRPHSELGLQSRIKPLALEGISCRKSTKHKLTPKRIDLRISCFPDLVHPEAPGASNGRPDPSIRHPGGVWDPVLFEGPDVIGSVWACKMSRSQQVITFLTREARVPCFWVVWFSWLVWFSWFAWFQCSDLRVCPTKVPLSALKTRATEVSQAAAAQAPTGAARRPILALEAPGSAKRLMEDPTSIRTPPGGRWGPVSKPGGFWAR